MLRLLKYLVLLKILNPFRRGFTLLRLLGCAVVALGLISYYGMPDWLSGMIRQGLGNRQQAEGQRRPGSGGYASSGKGSAGAGSGSIFANVLGEGEKAVGGILDSVLQRDPPRRGESSASAGGGSIIDLIGKGEKAVEDILSGSRGSGRKESQPEVGFGPPPEFTGGTVTVNPELFSAYASHGLTASQLRTVPDSPMPPVRKPEGMGWQTITSVVDGDSVMIGREKVRLIGIDAPEAQENEHFRREMSRVGGRNQEAAMLYMGREAAEFVRRLAEGRRCWLEFDGAERDQFGRVLAYVHLEDGTNLNEAILYQGYAKVFLGSNFKYVKRYIYLQEEAMRRGNGLWGGAR